MYNSFMASIGQVSEIVMTSNFKCTIKNFFSFSAENGNSIKSLPFELAGAWLFLSFHPNVDPEDGSEGFLGIYLCKDSGPPINVQFTFGLKNSEGEIVEEKSFPETLLDEEGFGNPRCISRSELLSRKSELLPDDNLTVYWIIRGQRSTSDESDDVIEKCIYCEEYLNTAERPFHGEMCPDKLIKCPICSCDEIALRNWDDHECRVASLKADESLLQAWERVLLEGQNHDLILKVGNKELKAHRDNLRAQSKVFESMLNHDMKEKNSGVVHLPDCDPEDMEQFLLYLCTGTVESLDKNNMLGLYYIADKYDVQGLKEECCAFIKKSLSHTNICEVIQLATMFCDSSLLEKATEYFMYNMPDIVRTLEWQSFSKDNSTAANELLVKYFGKRRTFEF